MKNLINIVVSICVHFSVSLSPLCLMMIGYVLDSKTYTIHSWQIIINLLHSLSPSTRSLLLFSTTSRCSVCGKIIRHNHNNVARANQLSTQRPSLLIYIT
jgi:hypothetical protein